MYANQSQLGDFTDWIKNAAQGVVNFTTGAANRIRQISTSIGQLQQSLAQARAAGDTLKVKQLSDAIARAETALGAAQRAGNVAANEVQAGGRAAQGAVYGAGAGYYSEQGKLSLMGLQVTPQHIGIAIGLGLLFMKNRSRRGR